MPDLNTQDINSQLAAAGSLQSLGGDIDLAGYETLSDLGVADDFIVFQQLVGATLILRRVEISTSRRYTENGGLRAELEGIIARPGLLPAEYTGAEFRTNTFAIPIIRTVQKMTENLGPSVREYPKGIAVRVVQNGETFQLV